MNQVIENLLNFHQEGFQKRASQFQALAKSQSPHTLLITCSDSRIMPELLTNAKPGELFVLRNIANIVPPFSETSPDFSVASNIEFAVKVLKVKNIIVLGHSNCGGCNFILGDEKSRQALPNVKAWTDSIKLLKSNLDFNDAKLNEKLEKANITYQINNLLTYSCIKMAVKAKDLLINGVYYNIDTGICELVENLS